MSCNVNIRASGGGVINIGGSLKVGESKNRAHGAPLSGSTLNMDVSGPGSSVAVAGPVSVGGSLLGESSAGEVKETASRASQVATSTFSTVPALASRGQGRSASSPSYPCFEEDSEQPNISPPTAGFINDKDTY